MSDFNILLLSAGRRVELLQSFRRAAEKLDISAEVVAADCSRMAPALYFADSFEILPKIEDPDYINSIVKICIEKNIKLVVPTIDTDLLILAQKKEFVENNTKSVVLVSNPEIIEMCRDKMKSQKFFESNDFGVPKVVSVSDVEKGKYCYPLFIKPRSGSASINAFKVANELELELFLQLVKDPIIQEFVEGEEFTVDVFLDFESKVITVVPRLRISTRSGEISKGKIIKDREIIEDIKRLMETLKPIGHITVQLIKSRDGIKYIEINPRFGGGAPMSIQSGADSCENLFRLLMGEQLKYNEAYHDRAIYLRFDDSICISE